jgi:hypothetical protein
MEAPNRSIPRSPMLTAPILDSWTWERRIPSHISSISSDLNKEHYEMKSRDELHKLCFRLKSFLPIPSSMSSTLPTAPGSAVPGRTTSGSLAKRAGPTFSVLKDAYSG